MDKLCIVIPAYNEAQNIERVVADWHPIVEQYGEESKLIIIDDGSKDDTFSLLKKCQKEYPLLYPTTKKNSGHGATVLYGYHYALEDGANFVFQTDADGQTLAEEFSAFWELRNTYDMVIGNRCKREDGLSRVLVTKILKVVVLLCFGVVVEDANTPFRLMKSTTLKEQIGNVPKDFNLSNVLISVIYAKKKLDVKFLPISFRQRQGGVNSINLLKISKIGMKAIRDFRMIKKSI
ncbi:MAG: glycosyltransferase family 2 protein [Eubacteriales bacterium]